MNQMPINYKKYPETWLSEIRPRILKRAQNKCEECGVKNHSVGTWEGNAFLPAGGNTFHDLAGQGRLAYKEAKELVELEKINGEKFTLIILTIAHLDHDADNHEVTDDRLKALCQRCHLRYDLHRHVRKRKYGRDIYNHPNLFE